MWTLRLHDCVSYSCFQVYEPILVLGKERFEGLSIRVRVRSGGYTAQIYAIRQVCASRLGWHLLVCTCIVQLLRWR